jgi:hypothetical protein
MIVAMHPFPLAPCIALLHYQGLHPNLPEVDVVSSIKLLNMEFCRHLLLNLSILSQVTTMKQASPKYN